MAKSKARTTEPYRPRSTASSSENNRENARFGMPSDIAGKYLKFLREFFGYKDFHKLQWSVLKALLEDNRDVCAVLGTGYGKSFLYQFVAFYLKKIVLVISPYVSVMEREVNRINKTHNHNYACLLGPPQDNLNTIKRILALDYLLIYSTPGFISNSCNLKWLTDISKHVALIAVEEAHCLSKWGHEFRPTYLSLNRLRKIIPQVRVLALTANAKMSVRLDIHDGFKMNEPLIVCSSVDRANLFLCVGSKFDKKTKQFWQHLKSNLRWAIKVRGSAIIYTSTKSEAVSTAQMLTKLGLPCYCYYSQLPAESKKDLKDDFMNGKVRIITTLSTIKLDIDKPDVRLVVHMEVPSDCERYYQEIACAGRDGKFTKCLLYCFDSDIAPWKLRNKSQYSASQCEQLEQKALKMIEYTQTNMCRRRFLLEYFGDDQGLALLKTHRNCCDICHEQHQQETIDVTIYNGLDVKESLDVTEDALSILGLVREVNGVISLIKILMALRGSRDKTVPLACRRSEHYGERLGKTRHYLMLVAEHLISQRYMHYKTWTMGYTTPQIDPKGRNWLDCDPTKREPIVIMAYPELLQHYNDKVSHQKADMSMNPRPKSDLSIKKILFALKSLRHKWAIDTCVKPTAIISNETLENIAIAQPMNMQALEACNLDTSWKDDNFEFGLEIVNCMRKIKSLKPIDRTEANEFLESILLDDSSDEELIELSESTDSSWEVEVEDEDNEELSRPMDIFDIKIDEVPTPNLKLSKGDTNRLNELKGLSMDEGKSKMYRLSYKIANQQINLKSKCSSSLDNQNASFDLQSDSGLSFTTKKAVNHDNEGSCNGSFEDIFFDENLSAYQNTDSETLSEQADAEDCINIHSSLNVDNIKDNSDDESSETSLVDQILPANLSTDSETSSEQGDTADCIKIRSLLNSTQHSTKKKRNSFQCVKKKRHNGIKKLKTYEHYLSKKQLKQDKIAKNQDFVITFTEGNTTYLVDRISSTEVQATLNSQAPKTSENAALEAQSDLISFPEMLSPGGISFNLSLLDETVPDSNTASNGSTSNNADKNVEEPQQNTNTGDNEDFSTFSLDNAIDEYLLQCTTVGNSATVETPLNLISSSACNDFQSSQYSCATNQRNPDEFSWDFGFSDIAEAQAVNNQPSHYEHEGPKLRLGNHSTKPTAQKRSWGFFETDLQKVALLESMLPDSLKNISVHSVPHGSHGVKVLRQCPSYVEQRDYLKDLQNITPPENNVALNEWQLNGSQDNTQSRAHEAKDLSQSSSNFGIIEPIDYLQRDIQNENPTQFNAMLDDWLLSLPLEHTEPTEDHLEQAAQACQSYESQANGFVGSEVATLTNADENQKTSTNDIDMLFADFEEFSHENRSKTSRASSKERQLKRKHKSKSKKSKKTKRLKSDNN